MFTVLDNPLVWRDITFLRDKTTSPDRFRVAGAAYRYGVCGGVCQVSWYAQYYEKRRSKRLEGAIGHDVILLPVREL